MKKDLEAVSCQFTIGKIDAGQALLISSANTILEIPSSLLPDCHVGSILNLTLERNLEEEEREKEAFKVLQSEMFESFMTPPNNPVISIDKITQTSLILKWEPLHLHQAKFKSLQVFRNGVSLSLKPGHKATQIKLTGLQVATPYEIYLSLKTSAGTYASQKCQITTHSMENLSGLFPCFGAFSNDADIDTLVDLLSKIGAKFSDDLTSDNTHLICTLPKGPKYDKAIELNIPCVTPEFLKTCQQLGKVQSANPYYVIKATI